MSYMAVGGSVAARAGLTPQRKPLKYKGFLKGPGWHVSCEGDSAQAIAMKPLDKLLVRKLAAVLVIKLAVLLALWWVFVREQRVAVDGEAAAARLLGPQQSQTKE